MTMGTRLAEPVDSRTGSEGAFCRMALAQAPDGPAPTLVVDLTTTPPGLSQQELRLRLLVARRIGMREFPGTGSKTVAILPGVSGSLRLLFVQGIGDVVDPRVNVCVNSGSAALAVARHVWHLVPEGPIDVEMGSAVFTFREVA